MPYSELFFRMSPLIVLAVSSLMVMVYSHNIGMSGKVGKSGILFAFIINSFLLLNQNNTIQFSSINISSASLVLAELFLGFGLIVFMSIDTNMQKILNGELLPSVFLLLLTSLVGTVYTNNLLMISSGYIISVICAISLFYFAPYQKKINLLKRIYIIIVIIVVLIIFTNVLIFVIFRTLELNELILLFGLESSSIKTLVFILSILSFSGICGIVPFTYLHLREYFKESNPFNLRVFVVLILPSSALTTLRVINTMEIGSIIHSQILFVIAITSIVFMIPILFMELFGKLASQSRSIPKIIGYLSALEYNEYLLMMSILGFSGMNNYETIIHGIFIYMILSMITKLLLIEGLSPIFEVQVEWDLNQLGGYSKIYPRFVWILLSIPIIYACPGLLGYRFDLQILPFLFQELPNQPIFFAAIWIIIGTIIILQLVNFLVVGTILNEVYFGKAKSIQKEVNPTLKSTFYYPSIILYGIILGLAIITNFFNYYFTDFLSMLYNQILIF